MKEVYQQGNAHRGRGVGPPMRSTPVFALGVLSLLLLACEGEAPRAVEGVPSPEPVAEATKPAAESAQVPDWQALADKALREHISRAFETRLKLESGDRRRAR